MTPTDASSFVPDPHAQAGKWTAPAAHAEVLVVGAGPAGLTAAIEAAHGGARVTLVDEHPVSGEVAGLDVPFFFGGLAGAALGNKARMLERILAANPRLEEAFEAGVEVLLGTCCWGAFVEGPASRTLGLPLAGLCDDARSWLVSFDRLILATGARDLVLFFEGADQPGVMGALGFDALVRRYDAFEGRRVLVLGTGDLALDTAELALERGLAVAGLVEVRAEPEGRPDRIEALARRGVPVFLRHVVRSAERGPYGVVGAVLAPLGEGNGADVTVACDTIVLAVDRVPVVDLADVAGARLRMDGGRGGHVPAQSEGAGRTSLECVFAAGDAAGLVTLEEAEAEGRLIAMAALASLGRAAPPPAPPAGAPKPDRLAYRLDWMRALLETGSPDVLACQCEAVTRGDLLGVRPPRYLGTPGAGFAARSLLSLAEDGPIDQDHVKRLTRACMGVCQARRCREQVAMMLAIGSKGDVASMPPAGYRAPVRPLPLGVLAGADEGGEMTAGWDVWFGIRTQWVPYADIGTEREAAFLGLHSHL